MRLLALPLLALLAGCGSQAPVATSTKSFASPVMAAPTFADLDPHDWAGRTPWHYPVHGIDVSRWQADIDWPRVRRSGASFAFIKATEGGDFVDPMFATNWSAAAAAGMPRGAYHFYYFCRPAVEQAAWFIRNVPKDPGALPPVLDVEWNHKSKTCTQRPNPDMVRAEMRTFLQLLTQHYGKRPIIYVTPDFYRENDLAQIAGHHFWLRSVAGHPEDVYPGQPWAFWQYTGTGVVDGIEGPTDINVFAGGPGDWNRWIAASAL